MMQRPDDAARRDGGIRLNSASIDERRRLRDLEPMRILQDAIEEALHGLPQQALAALIEKKLAAQGVTLSARQRKLLTRKHLLGDLASSRVRSGEAVD